MFRCRCFFFLQIYDAVVRWLRFLAGEEIVFVEIARLDSGARECVMSLVLCIICGV